MTSADVRVNGNKFADPSKLLYGEQVKQQTMNGSCQPFIGHASIGNGRPRMQSNGTLSSTGCSREPRMSLNINPMNDMDAPSAEAMRLHVSA